MADHFVHTFNIPFSEDAISKPTIRRNRANFDLPPGICTKIELAMQVAHYLGSKRIEPRWQDVADFVGCSRATAWRYLSAFRRVNRQEKVNFSHAQRKDAG